MNIHNKTATAIKTQLLAIVTIALTINLAGCNQERYQPAQWRERPAVDNSTTLPGTTLPGTTLPGTTLPGLNGTTLPGTTLPGTTLPTRY